MPTEDEQLREALNAYWQASAVGDAVRNTRHRTSGREHPTDVARNRTQCAGCACFLFENFRHS